MKLHNDLFLRNDKIQDSKTKSIDFNKHKFAVIGLGDTGLSIIEFLKYKQANIVAIFDTRSTPPHQDLVQDYKLHFGALNPELLMDIDVIVISPGVSIYEPALQFALQHNKPVIGDIELFALAIQNWPTKVIGITGSNGKTTVTTLTGYLASAAGYNTLVAGNIGIPVLTSYIEISKNKVPLPEVIVLELSSFQLETTYSLKLDSATVLNISEDHLDRYRDLLEYAYAKAQIFNNAAVQVLNADDPIVVSMHRQQLQTKWFGINTLADYTLIKEHNQSYLSIMGHKFLNADQLQLIGLHNYFNCLASLALLDGARIDTLKPVIKDALLKFQGLEHRMQKVLINNGITYIEDSKGTNIGAVIAGVDGLDMPVHLILGGDGKGQDFAPLRDLVRRKCKSVALIGQDKVAINQVLAGLDLNIQCFTTLEEAVTFCIKNASSGEAVILSPACASWDMFENYKHRAKIFIDSIYANI